MGCVSGQATPAELAAFRAERGALAWADTVFAGCRGRYEEYRVRLASSTGLVATGRLLRPADGGLRPAEGGGPYAAVLLEDGRELDSRALEYLPREFGDVVVLALDYPSELPYAVDARVLVRDRERLLRAARRVPALFSLGGVYLAQRADVDSARLALVASSFAVPFATIAAAMDARFRNVALIYGAGRMAEVVEANLTVRPRWLRHPLGWLATRPYAALAPERFVARIAPRPLVMVNGIDDPQMPRSAVRALYGAARAPREMVWLRTGHLQPGDSTLIRSLVDTALARLPVLASVAHVIPAGAEGASADAPRSDVRQGDVPQGDIPQGDIPQARGASTGRDSVRPRCGAGAAGAAGVAGAAELERGVRGAQLGQDGRGEAHRVQAIDELAVAAEGALAVEGPARPDELREWSALDVGQERSAGVQRLRGADPARSRAGMLEAREQIGTPLPG